MLYDLKYVYPLTAMSSHETGGQSGALGDVWYDAEAEAYKVDPATVREQGVSISVILAVADVSGMDPNEQKPLNDVVDPEALDDLFARAQESAGGETDCVSFTYSGFRVTVYRDGEVVLQPRDPAFSPDE